MIELGQAVRSLANLVVDTQLKGARDASLHPSQHEIRHRRSPYAGRALILSSQF